MKPLAFKKQQGQVLVVVAVSLTMLVAAVGLAVDSGMGYLIKAKLNAAADAASIAGARASARGSTVEEQHEEAKAAAKKFFAANYPAGYLGSSVQDPDIDVTIGKPTPGRITVDVAAKASVPVSFMGIAGFNLLNVSASSQTIRKDLDMAFVVDTSGSMWDVASDVRNQASAFLDHFSPTTDRVALIHFSSGAVVDQAIRTTNVRGFNRNKMQSAISNFEFTGLTNSSEGFWHARNQLNSIDKHSRSSMRVIVFFSDGSPNTFASYFNFKSGSSCKAPGSLNSNDLPVGSKTADPYGLTTHTEQNGDAVDGCDFGYEIPSAVTAHALPKYYNAHDPNDREFRVVTDSPRNVDNNTSTKDKLYANVNLASKNLVEAMAAKARSEGIHVFTLGLGQNLKEVSGASTAPDDTGENLLKCMANTDDAPSRCQTEGEKQPHGVYCFAPTANDLQRCYSTLASEILRLTQ